MSFKGVFCNDLMTTTTYSFMNINNESLFFMKLIFTYLHLVYLTNMIFSCISIVLSKCSSKSMIANLSTFAHIYMYLCCSEFKTASILEISGIAIKVGGKPLFL